MNPVPPSRSAFRTFHRVIAALAFTASLAAGEYREFKDVTGRTVKAEFIGLEEEQVVLKLPNGSTAKVPVERFSKEDRDYIAAQEAKNADAAKAVNEALGFPAFTDDNFTGRKAEEIAGAMKLPLESESPVGNSWRLYAAVRVPGYKLFGAVPYSVALYSNSEGKAESLSIVFANKGDYGSKAGFATEHFNNKGGPDEPTSLADAMQRDHDLIQKALTRALGEGQSQRFGDTGTRRTALRWDWNDHSFLLSLVEGEYVSVQVVPSSHADAGGRSERVSDAQVRERLEASVRREDNGDVWVSGIPMVDQGPKGYCVPATFERAMRHMGVEADMYLLAMVGQSGAGGGTVVEHLIENLRSQVYRKGRRLRDIAVKDLRIRDVQRHIDSGIPLLWRMCSMPEYNEIADKNTDTRGGDGHGEWLETVKKDFEKREKPSDNYHLCMIIGYNEKTGEIAVSDSWGKRFELRWVPIEVANWVDNGSLVLIQP
jgi:hypothetical protein